MKMSEENYKMFTNFYNFTVETATDEDIKFLMSTIRKAAGAVLLEQSGVKKEDINYDNPELNKKNAEQIRNFFEDFLAKANDNDAIYLMEGINSLLDFMRNNPKEVAKFVTIRKKQLYEEYKKNLEKEEKTDKPN